METWLSNALRDGHTVRTHGLPVSTGNGTLRRPPSFSYLSTAAVERRCFVRAATQGRSEVIPAGAVEDEWLADAVLDDDAGSGSRQADAGHWHADRGRRLPAPWPVLRRCHPRAEICHKQKI